MTSKPKIPDSAFTRTTAETPLDADTQRLAEALIEQLGAEDAVMLAVQIIQLSAQHMPAKK